MKAQESCVFIIFVFGNMESIVQTVSVKIDQDFFRKYKCDIKKQSF